VKISALAALKKDIDAELLAKEIRSTVSDPEISRAAELQLATGLIRREQFEKAVQICDAAIHESTDETVLAEAWTKKGGALTAQRRWDEALVAYLHVPIFFHDEKLFLPPAILGSARSYRRLDDNEHARRAFNELISTFPKSAEASVAQKELQKLPK
jgi:TolA-binding protein